MSYRGHIKNGMIVLDEPTALPEGAEVRVQVVPMDAPASQDAASDQSLYETLKPFIGAFKGLPPDASVNHDHYLYGTPKQQ